MRYPPVPTRWNGTCHERQCPGCARFLPRDIAHFYKDAGKPDGLSSRCVECVRPAMRERMRKKAAAHTQMRQYAIAAREGRVSA